MWGVRSGERHRVGKREEDFDARVALWVDVMDMKCLKHCLSRQLFDARLIIRYGPAPNLSESSFRTLKIQQTPGSLWK